MTDSGDHVEALLRAILALLADERESRTSPSDRRTELILRDAGMDAKEIAAVLGKNYEAVRKAIQRGRKE